MSITSSNNFSVNNSLTVNGNTILGNDSTDTLIVNSTSTVNNGLNINGNIAQNSGTFSTSSDNVYLNGDIIIANNKKLTTSIGLTTINGITQANNNIYVLSGKSLYITDSIISKYLRNYHDGTNAYIDYTGNLYFRYNGSTTALTLNNTGNLSTNSLSCTSLNNSGSSSLTGVTCTSLNNSGSYNAISCTSLNNSGSSSLAGVSCTSLNNSGSYNAISCTSLNNSGSYNAISCTSLNNSGSSSLAGVSCTSLTNSGSSSLNSVSCTNFAATNIISAPSVELGPSGTSNFTYIDMKTYGSGTTLGGPQFDFDVRIGCTGGSTASSGQGALSFSCSSCTIGSNLTVNGSLTASSISNSGATSLNYTTLPTFTSSMVGYQSITYFSSTTSITSGLNYTLSTFTLPMGVWNVAITIIFYASSGGVTINSFTLYTANSTTLVVLDTDMNNQAIIIASTATSYYKSSYIYQNSTSSTININYTQNSYTGSGLQVLGSSNSFVKLTRIA